MIRVERMAIEVEKNISLGMEWTERRGREEFCFGSEVR